MAKQDILAGGYYGKLGNTVGQRWKNIRTVRSYVIPEDPQTPAQLAERGYFDEAVKVAQIGQACNYKTDAFYSSKNSRWALRMQAARILPEQNLSGLDTVPLFPIGFKLPYTYTSVKYGTLTVAGKLGLELEGKLPKKQRACNIIVHKHETLFDPAEVLLFPATFYPDKQEQLEIPAPYGQQVEIDDLIRIVSTDDVRAKRDMFSGWQEKVWNGEKPEGEFDTEVLDFTVSTSGVRVIFAQEELVTVSTSITATLYYVSENTYCEKVISGATLAVDSGHYCVDFSIPGTNDWEKPAFPSGSRINITEVVAETETKVYKAIDKSELLTEELLTRLVEIQWTAQAHDDYVYYFTGNLISTKTNSKGQTMWIHQYAYIDEDPWVNTPSYGTLKLNPMECTLSAPQTTQNCFPGAFGSYVTFPETTLNDCGVEYKFSEQILYIKNNFVRFKPLTINADFIMLREESGGSYIYKLHAFTYGTMPATALVKSTWSNPQYVIKCDFDTGSTYIVYITGYNQRTIAQGQQFLMPVYRTEVALPTYHEDCGIITPYPEQFTDEEEDIKVTMNGITYIQPIIIKKISNWFWIAVEDD